MRTPNPDSDFIVEVDDIGNFTFGQRKMEEQLKINVEYARILDGVTPTDWLENLSTALCTLRVLMVRAPAGFVLDELDPLENDDYDKLFKVFYALRAKEGSFRGNKKGKGAAAGAGAQ